MTQVEYERLQRENADLRQRIDDLEYMLTHASDKHYAKSLCLKAEFGLTMAEAKMLAMLSTGKLVSQDQFLSTCKQLDPDPRTHAVIMHRLRKKMPQLVIKTVWGAGYKLEGDGLTLVAETIERRMPEFQNAKDPYFAVV